MLNYRHKEIIDYSEKLLQGNVKSITQKKANIAFCTIIAKFSVDE